MNAVSNGSKILKWKQITTIIELVAISTCCFQWFKDTKMKANHNYNVEYIIITVAVSNGSKILKWKQITTKKLSKLKILMLFPMVQRY